MKLELVLIFCLSAPISATATVEILSLRESAHPPKEAIAAKARTSRQAQYPPQYAPQTPHCLPPPAPFEGTRCFCFVLQN